MASVISGDANVSATEFGYLDGVTSALQTQMDAKAPLASPTFTGTPELPAGTTLAGAALTSGKILQVVRATDTSDRTTTSTSYVDANLSVTITPQKSDSAIILMASFWVIAASASARTFLQITDNSNNTISGAQESALGVIDNTAGANFHVSSPIQLFAYATPATTSAVTYKVRWKSQTSFTSYLQNATNTAQMYAIEVSA